MTIATQRRYVRTYVRMSASRRRRRRRGVTHCYVSELSSSRRRRLLVPTGIALLDDSHRRTGGDNISATSIRRSQRSASNGHTSSLKRRRERERERNRGDHSAYARRVLPAHALLPPGTWYRNHEASRSGGEEKEHCPSRCAASLSRPVEDRGYVTTSVFEIASS